MPLSILGTCIPSAVYACICVPCVLIAVNVLEPVQLICFSISTVILIYCISKCWQRNVCAPDLHTYNSNILAKNTSWSEIVNKTLKTHHACRVASTHSMQLRGVRRRYV